MSTWQTVLLGDIATFRNGVNYTKDNFGQGVKVINVKDFRDYVVPVYSDLDQINPVGVVRAEHLLEEGDVVFVRSNGNRELIGRSMMLLSKPHEPITHSAFTIRARMTRRPDVHPRYYAYVFRSGLIRNVLSAHGSGANISNLNQDILARLQVPLPPLDIQRRIAGILSAYDDLIENNTRRIAILEEMARRLYEEWFVHFRFPGHEGATFVDTPEGRLPEGWAAGLLGDFVTLNYGKALKASARVEGPFPVYGSSGVVGTHTESLVDGPGIIVGRKGNVGSVFWSFDAFYPIDTVYYVRTSLPLEYVFLNLQRQRFLNNDAAVPGLNRNQAYSLRFVVPSAELMQRFAKMSAPLFQLGRRLELQNANLRAQRDLLLPKLVSGEVDVSAAVEALTEAAE